MTSGSLSLEASASAIETKQMSPSELLEVCLSRLDQEEDDLQAFVYVDEENAREAARALSDEVVKTARRGPLHGIPIACKDNIDVAGMPTRAGSSLLSPKAVAKDAAVVAALRAGGAVILGKCNMDEFAYGVFSEPTKNPVVKNRSPGGSSGGPAAAVAAGMTVAAVGTDTAGSIRIPASACGVAGVKLRSDSVSLEGVVPLAPRLDTCGFIAATVDDVRLMLGAMLGGIESPEETRAAIGIFAPEDDQLGLDEEVAAEYGRAIDELRTVPSFDVKTIAAPEFSAWERPRSLLLMYEALQVHRSAGWYPEFREAYGADVAGNLAYAERFTASDVDAAVSEVDRLQQRLLRRMKDVDAIVYPTTPMFTPLIDHIGSGSSRRRVLASLTRLTGPINCCPLAVVTVPGRTSGDGVPLGLDVVAASESTASTVARKCAPAFIRPVLAPCRFVGGSDRDDDGSDHDARPCHDCR